MLPDTTVAAIATPPGQGGIAVLRISGPQTYEVAEKVFLPKNKNRPVKNAGGYTVQYGFFYDGENRIDDGIAVFYRAPQSYTGEDMIEFSCHGGETVSNLLLAACLKAGAQPAGPGEYTKRAVLSGRLPLTAAEAVMDVISAQSAEGAFLAGSALAGALHRQISEMKNSLVKLAAHLTAYTDYPEEDVEILSDEDFLQVAESVNKQLDELIGGYDAGAVLKRGVNTAIVGSPNVGKSTLFNLLSGFGRSIVTPVAGTTRDIIKEQVKVGRVVLNLSDTAGLHQTDDIVEQEGIRRSRQAMEEATLVIAVFDASETFGAGQKQLAEDCRGHKAIAIINKSDLGANIIPEDLSPYFAEVLVISATNTAEEKETAGKISAAAEKLLHLDKVDTAAPGLANQRQLSAAAAARDALTEGICALKQGLAIDAAGVCLEDSIKALSALTGEDAGETILEEVFSNYCVGK